MSKHEVDKKIKQIQCEFDNNFNKFRDLRIAIYGMGKNARLLLNNIKRYNFCAVIDKDHSNGEFCGCKIKPLVEAVEESDLIIIAAATRNINLIFNRIKSDLPNGFPVYSIFGSKLEETKVQDNTYWNKNIEELKQEIEKNDVISFDIFDTLLARKVLHPNDIFSIMEEEIRADGIDIPFLALRKKAENIAGDYATLDDVYDCLAKLCDQIDARHLVKIKEREVELEITMSLARNDIVEAFGYAKAQGKTVCILSDMYLPRKIILKMLSKQNITGFDCLLVSCEENASKSDGKLFYKLRSKYPNKRILHIGDNEKSDIEKAEEVGLSAYRIYSIYDLIAESELAYLLDNIETLEDYLLLGNIMAYLLNSPFVMNTFKGKLPLKNVRDLGVACGVGIAMCFLEFLSEKVKNDQNAIVLFSSRDCYFLHKIWEKYRNIKNGLPEGKYFYTSRKAATGACVKDGKDIDVLLSDCAELEGESLRHIVEQRFDCDLSSLSEFATYGEVKSTIERNREAIIQESAIKRKGYLNYLRNLSLDGKNIYLIDIVTRGTVAYMLARILNKPVHLVSFGLLDYPNQYLSDDKFVDSLLGTVGRFSALSGYWVMMEMLFASADEQLERFDESGIPQFVKGSKYNEKLIKGLREAMQGFIDQYPDKEWLNHKVSVKLSVALLMLLNPVHTYISDELYSMFDFYDPLSVVEWGNLLKDLRDK